MISKAWAVMSGFAEKVGDAVEGTVISVSSEEKYKRLSICQECDSFKLTTKQCNECGCPLQQKARMILDACPLDKWGIDDSDWETRFNDIKEGIDNELEE